MVNKQRHKQKDGFNVFEEVAATETPSSNENSNDNEELNVSSNINNSKFNTEEDPLESLKQENPAKAKTTKLHGVYFDLDVSAAIDTAAKSIGKGGKSALINRVMKKYLVEKGYIR